MGKHSVIIKDYAHIREEFVANAAITPGHLVELMSTGKVRVHATAGGNCLPMFAVEDELQGKEISEAYAADDQVQVWVPQRGDEVYCLIKHAQTIAIGDFLESAGDGTLQKHVADVADSQESDNILGNQIIGIAMEAVTIASSGLYDDDDPRCIVKIY
jgi:hypothetical protein